MTVWSELTGWLCIGTGAAVILDLIQNPQGETVCKNQDLGIFRVGTKRRIVLWIDESPITLCQRVRFQRGRTKFFIVLVP